MGQGGFGSQYETGMSRKGEPPNYGISASLCPFWIKLRSVQPGSRLCASNGLMHRSDSIVIRSPHRARDVHARE